MKIHLISLQALIQVQFQHSCCISVVHCANPVNLTGGIYNIKKKVALYSSESYS